VLGVPPPRRPDRAGRLGNVVHPLGADPAVPHRPGHERRGGRPVLGRVLRADPLAAGPAGRPSRVSPS
jgi:hypothetical protein